MQSFTAFLILALASIAQAAKYDNTGEAASIDSASSTLNGAGDYTFTNAKTGQTLSFSRSGVTNLFPLDNGDPLTVQFSGSQARLSGGNNKCVSAQWQALVGRGYDNAAVSYACTVGTGLLTGTATLEKTKQWWYLYPASGSAAPSPPSTDDASSPDSSSSSGAFSADVGITLAASDSDDTTAVATTKKTAANVNPSDRSTWLCPHSGQWVHERPGYINSHPECQEELDAYTASLRMVKKAKRSHHEMAQNLKKRGSQAYYIIAVDHILDQATRAIGSDSIVTPGGYTSTVLNLWNKSDPSQLWYISPA